MVPEDVLERLRYKPRCTWTQEQDVNILELWVSGLDNKEIWQKANFDNKTQEDVRSRLEWLSNNDRDGVFTDILVAWHLKHGGQDYVEI